LSSIDLQASISRHVGGDLGSTNPIKIDVRFISATHRNLEEGVKDGTFREDLYYRLNVVAVNVPPLRDRKEDIPLLANHFLQKFVLINSKRIEGMSGDAMKLLMSYDWPGNIRELENIIERAVVVCKGNEITPEDMPEILRIKDRDTETNPKTLDDSEKNHIENILAKNNWNISKSAKELGIDRVTLYNKIKKYQLKK